MTYEYLILSATDATTLQTLVLARINEDYALVGGLTVDNSTFYQAMFKVTYDDI